MGDMADMAIEHLFNLDEMALNGEYDEVTGDEMVSPFCREPRLRPSGEGLCPKCGGKTHKVEGSHGTFWGCDKFPKCNGSRDWKVE